MANRAETTVLDVGFHGEAGVIACGLLPGAAGVALVDPGPASSLEGLRGALASLGFSLADVGAILVTHIHLDHSGAAGTIVREHPRVRVHVHERGAPHMIDPARLLRSAARLYGDQLGPLWGEVAPVPAANVRALAGGERLDIAGREVEVAYTPGHAVHHVSYLDVSTGTAFTGDVGGMCLGRARFVVPPTPPPDIDVEQWEASIAHIRGWHPRRLCLTHFGFVDAPESHLDELIARLRRFALLVRESLAVEGRDADRVAGFKQALRAELRKHLSESDAAQIEREAMVDDGWLGLARYWRRRDAEAGEPSASG